MQPPKVKVPNTISVKIGILGIDRSLLIKLLTKIHRELPAEAELFQAVRLDDKRSFRYPVIIDHAGRQHRFDLTVDDSTSPDDFIIDSISYLPE